MGLSASPLRLGVCPMTADRRTALVVAWRNPKYPEIVSHVKWSDDCEPLYPTAALDLIRAETLEEAARVALDEYRRSSSGEEIAAAIRALKGDRNDV